MLYTNSGGFVFFGDNDVVDFRLSDYNVDFENFEFEVWAERKGAFTLYERFSAVCDSDSLRVCAEDLESHIKEVVNELVWDDNADVVRVYYTRF